MAEFGGDFDMFDEVQQDLLVEQTLEWMTTDSNSMKPDLLKLAVDMSGIEKQSKEPFINFAFEKSNFTHSLGRLRISLNIRKLVSRQYFCFEFN